MWWSVSFQHLPPCHLSHSSAVITLGGCQKNLPLDRFDLQHGLIGLDYTFAVVG